MAEEHLRFDAGGTFHLGGSMVAIRPGVFRVHHDNGSITEFNDDGMHLIPPPDDVSPATDCLCSHDYLDHGAYEGPEVDRGQCLHRACGCTRFRPKETDDGQQT